MSPTAARSAQAAVAGVTRLLGTLAGSAPDQTTPWAVTDFNGTTTDLFPLPGDYQVGVQNFFTHDLTPGNVTFPRCHWDEDVLRERHGEAGAVFHQLICNGRREIAASMFYPACEAKDKPVRKPAQAYAKTFEQPILDKISARVLGKSAVLKNLDSWTLRDAPICPSTYDLIMISPPVGGQRQVYTEIASQLASLGFLVVTVDHPALSGAVEMSDGSFLYNVAGDSITYREAELLQVANLKTIMGTLAADELFEHSPLWNQEAMINANSTCALGHGLGGRVAMLMAANGMVSCSMVLDNRMPMPGPFSEENIPMSSTRPQDSAEFAPGDDEVDLGTIHPYTADIIDQALTRSPILKKVIGLAQGVADYAAMGIFKLVCYITNQCDADDTPEKRSLPDEVLSDDSGLSSYPPNKYHDYVGEPSYDYEYDYPYNPQPDKSDGSDDYYKAPPPPPAQPILPPPPPAQPIWPPPGVFPPGVAPPPPPPPPSNNTNDTSPPSQVPSFPPPQVPSLPPPQVPSFPPPQVPNLPPPQVPNLPPPQVPSLPPPHVPSFPPHDCGPDCDHHEGPEPCCPDMPEPPCHDQPEHPCHPHHGDVNRPDKGDDKDGDEHWEYEWDNCDGDDEDKEGKKGNDHESEDTEEDADEEDDEDYEEDDENGDEKDDGDDDEQEEAENDDDDEEDEEEDGEISDDDDDEEDL